MNGTLFKFSFIIDEATKKLHTFIYQHQGQVLTTCHMLQ
jgi:hypothetical protein